MSAATTMREIQAEVLEMSENMLTPAETLWRQTSRLNQTLPPKDNYSINQELVHTEALELRDFLIVRGYIVLYRKTTGNTINKLFVTHNKCIERISQIVIMGAAYKTARNEVPFVNIIGVDYLAPNYSSKSTSSRQFNDGAVEPGIFVTDDDKGLRAALREVHPKAPLRAFCVHGT
ncbi:hypothetical protein VTP01DRAFT_3172 [Rhizomucor pusillus]|uniref:uncharacterized protein n=1 Tax=Rhizomucor pusillus TaxID=4840 RepID=UPI003744351B